MNDCYGRRVVQCLTVTLLFVLLPASLYLPAMYVRTFVVCGVRRRSENKMMMWVMGEWRYCSDDIIQIFGCFGGFSSSDSWIEFYSLI